MREIISDMSLGLAGSGMINLAFYLSNADRVIKNGELDWLQLAMSISLFMLGLGFAILTIIRLGKDVFK